MNLHRLLRAAENVRVADRSAARLQRLVRTALERSRTDGWLRGSWLGHPVHPILIIGPLGAWVSASVLDLGSRHQDAARRLVGIGLLSTPATVVAGAADWSDMTGPQRRVGTVHATVNMVAASCYLVSYVLRGRGAHRAGALWSAAGLAGLGAGGALGGHLTYALGGGVHRWQPSETPAATDSGV